MAGGKLQRLEGKLLSVDGKLAGDSDCCCDEPECPGAGSCASCTENNAAVSGIGVYLATDYSYKNGNTTLNKRIGNNCIFDGLRVFGFLDTSTIQIACSGGTWILDLFLVDGGVTFNFRGTIAAAPCPGGTYNMVFQSGTADPGWTVTVVVT